MRIPPVSRESSDNPQPKDWPSICTQMGREISGYEISGQVRWNQLSGYLSTMMTFSQSFGNPPFEQAMTDLYTVVGQRGNWQQQLAKVRATFPSPPPSARDMKNAIYSALNSCNEVSIKDQGLTAYIQGFRDALDDLSGLASPKDRAILESRKHPSDLQNVIDGFLGSPDQSHLDAFKAAILRADQHW